MHFPQLNALIKHEIPPGSNILLTGPPGSGKTSVCDTLLSESLNKGVKCLYITTNSDPKLIRKKLKAINIDGLEFLDCYSWLVGNSSEPHFVHNLSNLNDLSVRIFGVANKLGEGIFFILDSISTLLLYNTENEVLRFLEVNRARMKRSNNNGIYVVNYGIHSEPFYNSLRHMFDAFLEIHISEEDTIKRKIRLHTFKGIEHNTSWVPLTISSGKAIIG